MTHWAFTLADRALHMTPWMRAAPLAAIELDDFIDRVQDALVQGDRRELKRLAGYARRHEDKQFAWALEQKQRLHEEGRSYGSRWLLVRWSLRVLFRSLLLQTRRRMSTKNLMLLVLLFGALLTLDHQQWSQHLADAFTVFSAPPAAAPRQSSHSGPAASSGGAAVRESADAWLREHAPAHIHKYFQTPEFEQMLLERVKAVLPPEAPNVSAAEQMAAPAGVAPSPAASEP